ncbi:hypothetical protein [Microbispora catharanthi]|uniref:Uncharacterized protein n=1 Tax=Microbispora catharanthi TaxID=1712871 RepID=A0A5N6BQV3_9ACTN|nr:hypothetical protein [Microbispora catharanthi]KAB8182822.1 hypothetical protein FH610_022825 [Microbispora catharanthi]
MRAKVTAGLLTATVGACVLVPTASAFAATGQPGAPRPVATTTPKQDPKPDNKPDTKPDAKRDDGENGSRSAAATSLTITASASEETAKRSRNDRRAKQLTLSGSLTSGRSGLATQTIAVYFRKAGSARYTYVTSTRTGSRGQYSVKVNSGGTGTWKAAFAGTPAKRQSSATVNVA